MILIVKGYIRKIKRVMGNLFDLKFGDLDLKDSFAVIVSHSDYLNSMGGTEKYIYEQVQYLRSKKNIDVIQIFPYSRRFFLDNKKTFYGVNLNEQFLGYYRVEEIVKKFLGNKKIIEGLYIHHLMYWQYLDFDVLLMNLKKHDVKMVYYMHDFFSFTPSVYKIYLSYNVREEQIYSVDHNYDIVDRLSSKDEVILWRNKFDFILSNMELIVVPSVYLKNIAKKVFPNEEKKIIDVGHLKLLKKDQVNKTVKEKIKIAYLGYKSNFKGWKTWQKLYLDRNLNSKYEFFHIGSVENYSRNVSCYGYSFIEGGIDAAVKLLNSKNIDIVILWSIVPESYSYTLHEAIAAGVPIITNKRSGNIYYVVQSLGFEVGIVLNDEKELYEFLNDYNRVKDLVEMKRYRYDLKFNENVNGKWE
ncbi:glycosyltransferase [Tepidibacter thalassicus]|uniref:Glycosyltransferase involved in cell wall bisynthesis n=1 Tax=Tepidibacter thalassicus DSM 15285 TaxID=1123350 RepID=A0A1M5S687_9FIRM|nr:glycosyltransferase [Tepidibacter thalassicus]SHH33999.1 Glycosyltransferase involved in cell wall bisynthesis [Tepidibacter thalassicus DSM 15285]